MEQVEWRGGLGPSLAARIVCSLPQQSIRPLSWQVAGDFFYQKTQKAAPIWSGFRVSDSLLSNMAEFCERATLQYRGTQPPKPLSKGLDPYALTFFSNMRILVSMDKNTKQKAGRALVQIRWGARLTVRDTRRHAERVITLYGSALAAAASLGITRQAIYLWRAGKNCAPVSLASHGIIKT